MWHVKNVEIRTTTLDFASSEQGRFPVSQLYCGNIQLINAIELVDWNAEELQFSICGACGYTHCKSGDWVSLRLSGSFLLILPAFALYLENDKVNQEYCPPQYIWKERIAYFDLPTYEILRSENSSFPPLTTIRKLKLSEAILAFQWGAPFQALGNPSKELLYQNDIIIAASEGDYREHIKRIEYYAADNFTNETPVILRSIREEENSISLFFDDAECTEWKAITYDEKGGMNLMLDSKYVIVPDLEN